MRNRFCERRTVDVPEVARGHPAPDRDLTEESGKTVARAPRLRETRLLDQLRLLVDALVRRFELVRRRLQLVFHLLHALLHLLKLLLPPQLRSPKRTKARMPSWPGPQMRPSTANSCPTPPSRRAAGEASAFRISSAMGGQLRDSTSVGQGSCQWQHACLWDFSPRPATDAREGCARPRRGLKLQARSAAVDRVGSAPGCPQTREGAQPLGPRPLDRSDLDGEYGYSPPNLLKL